MPLNFNTINFTEPAASRIQTIRAKLVAPFEAENFSMNLMLIKQDFSNFFAQGNQPSDVPALVEVAFKSFLQQLFWQLWRQNVLEEEDMAHASQILLSQCKNLFHLEKQPADEPKTLLWIDPEHQENVFNPLLNNRSIEFCNIVLKQAVNALNQETHLQQEQPLRMKRILLIQQWKKTLLDFLEADLMNFVKLPNELELVNSWREIIIPRPEFQRLDFTKELLPFSQNSIELTDLEIHALVAWLTQLLQEVATVLAQFTDPINRHSLLTFSSQCRTMHEFFQNPMYFTQDGDHYFLSTIMQFPRNRDGSIFNPHKNCTFFLNSIPASTTLLNLFHFHNKLSLLINIVGKERSIHIEKMSNFLFPNRWQAIPAQPQQPNALVAEPHQSPASIIPSMKAAGTTFFLNTNVRQGGPSTSTHNVVATVSSLT